MVKALASRMIFQTRLLSPFRMIPIADHDIAALETVTKSSTGVAMKR
jgi:hypothetical protein